MNDLKFANGISLETDEKAVTVNTGEDMNQNFGIK